MKILLKTLLGLIALTTTSAAIVLVIFKLAPDSIVAKDIHNIIVQNDQLVSLMNLSEPGDNRFVYLSEKYKSIPVIIAYPDYMTLNNNTSNWIREIIQDTIGKETNMNMFSLTSFDSKKAATDKDILSIRNTLRKKYPYTNSLYIIYLPLYQESSSNAGIAIHRDTIVIFTSVIMNLSEDMPTRNRLEQSTLMHEWGHLLGLPHLSEPSCVMADTVEVLDNYKFGKFQVSVDYCWDSLYMIKKLSDN